MGFPFLPGPSSGQNKQGPHVYYVYNTQSIPKQSSSNTNTQMGNSRTIMGP
ncbi:hypothetical protein RB653_000801 [Dictyostelium firmibasis]|uniref:Uncharacterized protein n=1 Tax=Dictyostelium firmibasis TaxID=79012 RepID=A0AAN7YY64_9MYCE